MLITKRLDELPVRIYTTFCMRMMRFQYSIAHVYTINIGKALLTADMHRERDQKLKLLQKENFDQRHRVRNLKPLTTGEKIWITDRKESGIVLRKVSNRSYEIEAKGGRYRRNRKHLRRYNRQMT